MQIEMMLPGNDLGHDIVDLEMIRMYLRGIVPRRMELDGLAEYMPIIQPER
jgi:hypothetical protein